ncbi:unnamed protein product [Mytilus coruscus]|uniref:Reverse transcriptase domain-containing protein n=1 Tax=Mytilus coruscus TaxID=42192 RepID=A0A6J8EB98_MYTCO|nr:unnamed protein product [Mytilus coruscus]
MTQQEVSENILEANTRFHCPVKGILNLHKPQYTKFKRKVWDFEKGDYDRYCEELRQVDWDTLLDTNLNNAVSIVTQNILDGANKYIPNSHVDSIRNWWKKLAGLPSKSSGYPPFLSNETYLDDNKDKAHAFNRYFCDQASVDESFTNIPELNLDDVIHTLDNIIITQEEVYDQLLLLDLSKATGSDSISPRFLKYAARELIYPLALLFNNLLQLCIYPYDWKLANVKPVYKIGSQEILSNYRPSSLLSIIGKTMKNICFKIFI